MKLDTDIWMIERYEKPTNHNQVCACCKRELEKGEVIYKFVSGWYDNYARYIYYHPICMAYTFMKNCEDYLTLSRKGKNKMKKLLDEIMVEEL